MNLPSAINRFLDIWYGGPFYLGPPDDCSVLFGKAEKDLTVDEAVELGGFRAMGIHGDFISWAWPR